MERLDNQRERMTSGREQYIAKCRKAGIKMGRPATYKKSDEAMKAQYAKRNFPVKERSFFKAD